MLDRPLSYGFGATVALPFPEALERTREALIGEGFGILSEVDLGATLRQRLGVEIPPYVILGACNPPLAHRALLAEPDVGLLMPCNVVVYEAPDPSRSVVAARSTSAAFALTRNPALPLVAAQVESRLRRALERVAASRLAPVTIPEDHAVDEMC